MKIEDVLDDFRMGFSIKRKDMNPMTYIPGDYITLECLIADDWESLKECVDEI